MIKRKRMKCHLEKACPNYLIKCDECKQIVLRKDSYEHGMNECPEKIINCPHASNGCNAKIKRKFMDNHVETQCGEKLLDCQKDCGLVNIFYIICLHCYMIVILFII